MFILPAEYGVDPLGTGARVGLLELGVVGQQVQSLSEKSATGAQAAVIVPQERAFKEESVEFTVGPREGMEYKYRLDKGEALLYSWKATGPVSFELHGEPDGAPRGYADSYGKGQAQRRHQARSPPHPGITGVLENSGNQASPHPHPRGSTTSS